MTAEQAIKRSQSRNEIVTIDHDDDVVGNDMHEFWGANDDGEWRVHVRAEVV